MTTQTDEEIIDKALDGIESLYVLKNENIQIPSWTKQRRVLKKAISAYKEKVKKIVERITNKHGEELCFEEHDCLITIRDEIIAELEGEK